DQSELQERAGVDEYVHDQRISVVPGRRTRLRQLHGAQSAELITASQPPQTKTPERKLRGFCFGNRPRRYCFGPPKSSGGSSICGTSILHLLRTPSNDFLATET